ncbi:unnamed protein product [Nippostrongylus brasiliensis]|uniref:Huntingtin (inferred by orthology to a human protein) n=1 Tax=Nippostrongylus brasiliensis TaxID=27835 RepID=A0A0N4XXC4_NIPBR|nr:unnamed protein product [Nippostrongylus brasiliensis]
MAAAKVERLERAINTLEAALKANDLVLANRKTVSYDKERNACTEIRGIIVANDFNTLHKADRRYGDLLTKAVEMIFKMINHIDQDIRTYAEESLDAVLRSLLLGFYHSRVLVLLITEIGRNVAARSIVCAFRRLAQLLHFSKCNRVVSYGVHIISALTAMLKRPEESIQNAIIAYAGILFDSLGPRMRSQHSEKAYDLYCAAADNLELSGAANRAAVTIISHVATYYPSIMNKAFLRCMVNVRDADDATNKTRLIGSLNTLKAIWPLLSEPGCAVTQDNIKIVICSVLCCLHSAYSEVVVPSIELLEKIMTNPLPWLRDFFPLKFDVTPSFRSKFPGSDRPSRTASPTEDSRPSSSLGSMFDVTDSADGISDFNVPLQLPDLSDAPSSSGSSSPTVEDEIIDPLRYDAELYEEVSKCDRYGTDANSSQLSSSPDDSVGILKHLPLDLCDASANCFVLTAAMLGKRFLLAGLKGLKSDRDVRISHKILALNCITTITKHEDLSRITLLFGDFEQSLSEVSRFVLHDDDQLCASTVAFLFSLDKYDLAAGGTENSHNYRRVMRAFQPIRKRSVLHASIGQQHVLEAVGVLPEALYLATTEVTSTFFLLKVTCAEFLSSLKWNKMKDAIKEEWQERCLFAYFDLLFSDDQKVAQAALSGLEQLVINADFTEYSGVFAARIPDDLISLERDSLPAVLNMPHEYRFRGECADFVVESNLEVILSLLMEYFMRDVQGRSEGLDRECETRFVHLLRAALECLGTICEMLTFSQLRPLLQEILLYVKVTFEVCPDGCTTLLHQMFKVVFGKNTANINLDILQSMKMKDPLPPLNEAEMLYLRYANEFTLFSAFVSRKEYMDTFMLRSMGWLKTDMLSRVHNPPPNEIAPALELFEGFVTVLLQVYGAFQSVPCKRAILGVMCELPRDGIIYAMADPRRVLFEAVTTQLTNVIKYDQVWRVAVELLEKAVQSNVNEIISAVEVILLETLFVQRVDGEIVYSAFRSKSKTLFSMASQRTLLLWTLFLHASRSDENRWSSTSIDFFAAYSEYSSGCSESTLTHSVYAVVTAFSCMAPSMYRPVDSVFRLLYSSISDETILLSVKLKRSVPLLFSILNNVAEEKLLMRAEQMIDDPLTWIVGAVHDLLLDSITISMKDDSQLVDYAIFLLQTVVNVFKAESYPKLSMSLQARLKNLNSSSISALRVVQPVMLSQWLQLFALYNEPLDKHVDLAQNTEYVARLCSALSSPSPVIDVNNESPRSPSPGPPLPTDGSLLEFCKSVFAGSMWCRNPRVFDTLLSLESQDIYYVYECVAEERRASFLGHLLKAVSDYVAAQSVYAGVDKSAFTKAKEILDIVYDLVEFENGVDANVLRLKLFVLSRIPLLNNVELSWGNFSSNEVVAIIDFAADEIMLPSCNRRATCEGLAYMMGHPSTREIFARDIFFGIQSIRKLLVNILKILEAGNPSRFDHLSATDKVTVTTVSDANLTEQILSSSVAVSVLTDILLYSLLYPEPGNPPVGHFVIKHRERNDPFYQSKSMQQLCVLKSRLTGDRELQQGEYYDFGQLSALSLWTLTGVLSEENPQQLTKTDSPRMRISLSEFILKITCELDTASSVRALFENFSHWFARGLDHLPLPLLSSTVRSMALLSDLFDDSSSYEFLYVQMRNVFRGGYLDHHPDIGYVIYSMLKSLTVIGLETASRGMTEADLAKQILSWVEYGLTSNSPFVREATLHGFIYLMQSMTLDPLKPVVQYVTAFLLEETGRQLSVTDPINVCDMLPSLEYSNLIWSVSFRIMEEPLQVSFKNTLIQRTCETFTVMNLSAYLLPVVTSGIEELALHSACYLPQFLQLVNGCFKMYATISSTFPYALRVFIVCVFKEETDPRRASAQKFEPILEELYNVEDRAVACCLLAAVSSYEDIAYRFSVYLAALTTLSEDVDPSYEFLLRKATEECPTSPC